LKSTITYPYNQNNGIDIEHSQIINSKTNGTPKSQGDSERDERKSSPFVFVCVFVRVRLDVPYFVKMREKRIRAMANPNQPTLLDPTRPDPTRKPEFTKY